MRVAALPRASARKNGYEMTKPERKKKSVTPTKPVAGRKASQLGGESHEISHTWYQRTSRTARPRKPSRTPNRGFSCSPPLAAMLPHLTPKTGPDIVDARSHLRVRPLFVSFTFVGSKPF